MLRLLAKGISVLFHPLLILTYILIILMLVNPYEFGMSRIGDGNSVVLLIRVFLSTFFLPAFAAAMLVFLGLVESIRLPDREDRIGPYIVTGIFYLWLFYNFYRASVVPDIFTTFMLGATIGLFLAFLVNIFTKVSTHAVGMGGLLAMISILVFDSNYDMLQIPTGAGTALQLNLNALLLILILIAGMVGTARLLLRAHEPDDVYGGYLIGFVAQLAALRIMMG